MNSEDLVAKLLSHSDDYKSMASFAKLLDGMKEDEPCVVSNVYEVTSLNRKVHNNIICDSFENSEIIAQCTICRKDDCKMCGSSMHDDDCPMNDACSAIEAFIKKYALTYEDIQSFIEHKVYPDMDRQTFVQFMKTYPLDKHMYKVELVMTGAPGLGFGKVALYSALKHMNDKDGNDGVVFLSVWKKSTFLKKYYNRLGFEAYNENDDKMRVLSLNALLSRLSTKPLPDAFVHTYNTLEPNVVVKTLLSARPSLKREGR